MQVPEKIRLFIVSAAGFLHSDIHHLECERDLEGLEYLFLNRAYTLALTNKFLSRTLQYSLRILVVIAH